MSSDASAKPQRIRLLDVVALDTDVPDHGLLRGHVGTVVESLPGGAFEVEFSDDEGRTYALIPVLPEALLVLHHRPVSAV